jgi:hypothetical protein
MNCKPDQLAWIVVPREYYGTGMEQLNNRVVRTVRLLSGYPGPTWEVTPHQYVTFSRPVTDHNGSNIEVGERRWSDGLPDRFLRPFDPNSEPLNEPASRELERTA